MPDRVVLSQIASTAYEHPADRAALNALRALPGFDELVRKVASFFGERGIRQVFLGNAVRVGPTQRPKLDALYTEVLETLDWPVRHELYVSQTPVVNAMAVGFDKPFIVVNSGLLRILDREEQRAVLAHELGHIMSGHATYTTLALLLIIVGAKNLPFLAGLALMPLELALFEWYRKAEFSADRAALLGSQDPNATMRVFLKFAGGASEDGDDSVSLDAFLAQAAEYEAPGGAIDKVWQMLNTAFRTHPMATVRAGELQRWVMAGDYDRIIRGDYPRRGAEKPPLGDDFADAAGYYGAEARQTASTFSQGFNRARDAFDEALKRRGGR